MDNLRAHQLAVIKDPGNPAAWGSLADHMDEQGVSGAHILREHTNNLQNGVAFPYYLEGPGGVAYGSDRVGLLHPNIGLHHAVGGTGNNPAIHPRVIARYVLANDGVDNFATARAAVTPDNVERIIEGMPQALADRFRKSVQIMYPETPAKLARTTIIPSGPKAGDEPGINMWTGKPLDTGGKPPIKALLVNEHHHSDGIVHPGVHPGTHAASPTADAAWYERSAVHRALEERAPGAPISQQDVIQHVQAIKTLLASDQGKKLLGAAGERYVSGAAALAKVLPPSHGSLIRGSAEGARPHGPNIDALTRLVHPLVGVANRLLAHMGHTTAIEKRVPPPTGPAIAPPKYEVVPPNEVNVPETFPEPKKARKLPPIALAEDVPALGGKTAGSRFDTLLEHSHLPREKAIRALMDRHLLTREQASATYRRWVRAELARRTMGPQKLARPKDDQALNPQHLYGEAFSYKGAKPGDPASETPASTKKTTYKIDPRIEGTSFAYHLRQMAQEYGKSNNHEMVSMIEHALAGRNPKGANGDPYATIGRWLEADNHPTAARMRKMYDWNKIDKGLAVDHWLEGHLREMVVKNEGENDSTYFDRIHRALKTGHAGLWQRIAEKVKSLGPKTYLFDSKTPKARDLLEALHRISDKHLDRDYLAAIKAEKGKGESHKPSDPLYWRDVMAKSKVKFRRRQA